MIWNGNRRNSLGKERAVDMMDNASRSPHTHSHDYDHYEEDEDGLQRLQLALTGRLSQMCEKLLT
jgi:hypothetical protein